MLSRTVVSRILRSSSSATPLLRTLSSTAGHVEATSVTLNFSLPHETIYKGASVFQVILPGVEGEYGVSVSHVPYVAQLKAGVVQIFHTESASSDVEKYFVPGGYALTHPNSVTDVVCPEAVKLDDIDPALVARQYERAKDALASAENGSKAAAEAQIDLEVNKAMGAAIGLTLS